jgi:hypothetical protein
MPEIGFRLSFNLLELEPHIGPTRDSSDPHGYDYYSGSLGCPRPFIA